MIYGGSEITPDVARILRFPEDPEEGDTYKADDHSDWRWCCGVWERLSWGEGMR